MGLIKKLFGIGKSKKTEEQKASKVETKKVEHVVAEKAAKHVPKKAFKQRRHRPSPTAHAKKIARRNMRRTSAKLMRGVHGHSQKV